MGEIELERAIDSLAAALAPHLAERARAEAVEEVAAELSRRLSAALLRGCEAELGEVQAEARAHPLAERELETAVATYVYGVAAAGIRLPAGLAGVDPARGVGLVEAGGLAAIVSAVPRSEFGEEPIGEKLEDVAWLEETARAHEDVLEVVLEAGAVVPLRLCTVFGGEPQVEEMLGRQHEVLLDALDRLGGKAEWGVKAFADAAALRREVALRDGDGDDGGLPGGTAYVNRKRREARERERVEEVADEWARLIHDRLAAAAAEALLNPLQRPEVSGHDGEMVLNGVYLVADQKVAGLREVVAQLRDELDRKEGVEVVLTGPWPAYNFVKSSIEAAR